MRRLLKAALWAALLSALAMWMAPGYQSLLLLITSALAGGVAPLPRTEAVDLSAANQQAILAALFLSSDFASWHTRLRRLAVGSAALILIECVTALVALRIVAGSDVHHGGAQVGAPGVVHALELTRWLTVPLLWGLLLGTRYSPRHRVQAGAPGSPPRK